LSTAIDNSSMRRDRNVTSLISLVRCFPGKLVNFAFAAHWSVFSCRSKLYYPRMIRCLAVLQMILAITLTFVLSASVANASPSGGAATGQCSFVLTPPKVVPVSGTSMVLAELGPGACPTDASPNSSVVCLAIDGDGSPGQCASASSPTSPAQLYYPYRAGATYAVRARGCADLFKPPYVSCQNFGPSHYTL